METQQYDYLYITEPQVTVDSNKYWVYQKSVFMKNLCRRAHKIYLGLHVNYTGF